MASLTIRTLQPGDEAAVATVLARCFGAQETWTPERVTEIAPAPDKDADRFWVAVDGSEIVGCVRAFGTRQPGTVVIRELAAGREPAGPILECLLATAQQHLSGLRPTSVRASTPDVSPYPDAYRSIGFRPVRRALTLTWELTPASVPGNAVPQAPSAPVVIGDALGHPAATLAELYVEGMRPYWDWFIDEAGGGEGFKGRVARYIAALLRGGTDQLWLSADADGVPIGLAFVSGLDAGEGDLGGVYVLPAHRGRGIGSMLLRETLTAVGRRASRLVVPETITDLDGDIPSIRLYKRSGARVRGAYLHLQAQART